jgi:hypothetical protein
VWPYLKKIENSRGFKMRKLLQTVTIFFLVFTIVFSAGCAGTTKNSENKSMGV